MIPESSISKEIPASCLHRATIAATAVKQLSDISSIPYLKVLAGVSLLILDTVQFVKTNKEQCTALIEKIDELLCIIIQLCVNTVTLSPGLLHAMGKFAGTLQKIEAFMRTQQDMGRFKRFFRQQENAAQLEDCKMGLRQALDAFAVTTSMSTIGNVEEMRVATERKHQELIKLIGDNHSFHGSAADNGSSIFSLNDSVSSLSLLLPTAPQIFHGRESELAEVAALLLQDPARIAILGPGGVGKTCLAKSSLHLPEIVDKYPDRYFVPCQSSGTVEDLALAVAAALGLELTARLSKTIIKHLSEKSSCLLVLDNFETPWEPAATRPKVEEFLSLLADLPHVALLVTMRGQERPLKIRWNRPFIQPLSPLSDDAAYRTFTDISDTDSDADAPLVAELLALTGNLPLAVTLMANAAAFDGCQSVLSRWRTENVSLLSDGFNKETNLETSLRLSLSSPRMASSPGALQLLSLLSLLPDGILDVDLRDSLCPIPELPRCQSTLLRTSLTYIEAGRLKVLAPVREIIRKIHPPSYPLVRQLRLHWDELLLLWRTYQMPSGDLVSRLTGNMGNMTSMLGYGLEVGAPDLKEVIHGIFHLNTFAGRTYGNHLLPMADIGTHIERVDDNQLRGYHIWDLINQGSHQPIIGAEDMIAQGCKYFQLAGDLTGEARLQAAAASHYIRVGDINKASIHADISFTLADKADNNLRRSRALCIASTCLRLKGKFREALSLARRAHWLASKLGDFQRETEALEEEAQAWVSLGNFPQAIEISNRVRQLLIASGLDGTGKEIYALDFEGDTYLYKTAYAESRKAHQLIIHQSSPEKFALYHGNSLAAIASIDIVLGVLISEAEVLAALEIPRQIFTARGYLRGLPICDKVVADFFLAKGRTLDAEKIYAKCLRAFRGEAADFFAVCVLKLGDINLMLHNIRSATRWAVLNLAHGKTTGSASILSWALRLLGDIFQADADDETSSALFQVALEEFNRMDIHRGKAECLLRLAEIAQKRGEGGAMDFFMQARREFVKSGMVAEADRIYSSRT
ncbi:hypothetical protein C8R44DRAFT_984139 [Mycena epipterygia]|nr:hypothetical protein C8R44DRAFT_984139 [Mycena epipterygia]